MRVFPHYPSALCIAYFVPDCTSGNASQHAFGKMQVSGTVPICHRGDTLTDQHTYRTRVSDMVYNLWVLSPRRVVYLAQTQHT